MPHWPLIVHLSARAWFSRRYANEIDHLHNLQTVRAGEVCGDVITERNRCAGARSCVRTARDAGRANDLSIVRRGGPNGGMGDAGRICS
eukprot:2004557-Rhodomonas_salina.1